MSFINYLRESNISKYTNIMSNEDVIRELLKQSTSAEDKKLATKPESIRAIADVFQSITTEAKTVNEMIEDIYINYCSGTIEEAQSVLDDLSSFITIIHDDGENNISESTKKVWSYKEPDYLVSSMGKDKRELKDIKKYETPFVSFKSLTQVDGNTGRYKHQSKYGLLSQQEISTILAESTGTGQAAGKEAQRKIYNVHEICHAKADADLFKSRGGDMTEIRTKNLVNATNPNTNICDATKANPSLAYVLIDHPDLRIGTRNSLELATFFNLLSTVELSKCQPFLNAVFVLPLNITSQNSTRVFKTASITQFFDGTPASSSSLTETYRSLEASFERKVGSGKTEKIQDAVGTNMSAFTMPQTINNFNEKFIGHNENAIFDTDMKFFRQNTVHDITRPFLTIKSFNIDVAPTQGLMSFKTGKLSLILHDRTRMVDIAPFIKPDLFGSFGAEIAIEYGWSHIDGKVEDENEKNISYLGQFLNKSRVTEKYIITNSSFSMDNTGQVNIDLSIAMRGPIDIRSVKLHSDPMQGIKTNAIVRSEKTFLDNLSIFNDFKAVLIRGVSYYDDEIRKDVVFTDGLIIRENLTKVISAETRLISTDDPKALKEAKFKSINDIKNNLKKARKKLLNADTPLKLIQAFKLLDPKKDKGSIYIGGSEPLIYIDGTLELTDGQIKEKIMFNPGDPETNLAPLKLKDLKGFTKSIVDYIDSVINAFVNNRSSLLAAEDTLIKKIMGGLNRIDPFMNTEFIKQYERITLQKDVSAGVSIEGLGKSGAGIDYVTFGSFITGLIGTHMSATGKFDEIQIVSYTCNENCGLFSNMNVSSMLINKGQLRRFLAGIFEQGATFTLESIISQVINRFINTRTNICYGLDDFYKIDPKTGNVEAKFKADKQKSHINDRLSVIYQMLANPDLKDHKHVTKELEDVRFVMPKIKFTFDTLTRSKNGFQKTISRISLFDQNDNPFGSINTIMKDIYDKDIVAAATMLNKIRRDHKSKFIKKPTKEEKTTKGKKGHIKAKSSDGDQVRSNIHEIAKHRFYQKSWSIIQDLINRGILVEISEGVYEITGQFKLQGLKKSFKEIMPSITYGTQNSAVIEASISTVNEAKLNTIYLTRSDRAADDKNIIQAKVGFSKDLPLRVLPSQATATIYGCPFVNFAQYIFLDFETGTTVDNAYAITGIKHDLSPGKFTTQLTLSYGDVYGKYENSAQTIARTINDVIKPTKVSSAREGDIISITSYSKRGDKLGDSRILQNHIIKFDNIIVADPAKNLIFNVDVVGSRSSAVTINKTSDNHVYKMYIYLNENIKSQQSAANKQVKISLNLSRDTSIFDKIRKLDPKKVELKAKSDGSTAGTPLGLKILGIEHVLKDLHRFDFIKDESFNEFIKELSNFVGLYLNIEFNYKGSNTKLSGEDITNTLKPGWDLFNRNEITALFNKYKDEEELLKIDLSENYKKKITALLEENKIVTIKNRPENIANYGVDQSKVGIKRKKRKKKAQKSVKVIEKIKSKGRKTKYKTKIVKKPFVPIELYTKPRSILFTTSGLEFEIVNGFSLIGENTKTKKKFAEFSYEKVVIEWKTLLNHIIDLNTIQHSDLF